MKKKNHEKKEVLNVAFEIKQIDDSDEKIFKFEGYASTFGDVDLGRDKILRGAFKDSIRRWNAKKKNLPVLWQHNGDEPIGVFPHLEEDEKGLFVKGSLPKDDSFVSGRVIPQLKIGSVASMSIGYFANEFEFERDEDDNLLRILKKIELMETSLVTFPMNPEADITDFKSLSLSQDLPLANKDQPWDPDAALKRVKSFLDSEEKPSSEYKNAFLWHNVDEKDNFGSYKLSIVDVIDGELKAVPEAIFATAVALSGAQGDIDIPGNEIKKARAHIARYYKKLDRESPFDEKTCFRVDFIGHLSERELEKLFRKGVFFSQNQAKKLVKLVKSNQCDVETDFGWDAKSFMDILTDMKNI